MNLFKITSIFLFAAVFACSGNNQSNSAAVTANNASPNSAAAVNNDNADPSKAAANVYKDYPADIAPKTVAAEDDSKNKKSPPKKPDSVKAETVKKTEPVSPSSDDALNSFKFSSNRRINTAARTSKRKSPSPVDAKEAETNLKDETNQKKDATKQP